jgi:hypothetical protein
MSKKTSKEVRKRASQSPAENEENLGESSLEKKAKKVTSSDSFCVPGGRYAYRSSNIKVIPMT